MAEKLYASKYSYCDFCGRRKSVVAEMCRHCRDELRRGIPIVSPTRYTTVLNEHWPIPIVFPPLVPGEPRTVRRDD